MREIYFGNFRSFVVQHIRRIDEVEYEVDSIEWFLLKYLRRLVKSTEHEDAPTRVEGSIRSLLRFYVDNIDEQSELGEQCIKIYEEYRKTLRYDQSN